MERKSAREVQENLAVIVAELLGTEDRLRVLVEALPESPNLEAMLEGAIPPDVETELQGSIECTLEDDLRPAIRRLEKAARATAESLRRDFEKHRRRP